MGRKSRSPTNTRAKSTSARSRKRLWFRLAAVGIGLLPFVVLEMSLRAFDAGRPAEYVDPFVGFSKLYPQFERNEEKGVYETTRFRQLFFGRQEFAAEKPENGFRVFCLGGSTVRGRPYTTETAFSRWMQIEFAATDPAHKYEVVNCGGLSYASYRLRVLLEEVLKYQPDAVVIAAGHNEFLEDRTFKTIKSHSQTRRWISGQIHSLRTVTAARRLWDEWRGTTEREDRRQQLPDKLTTRLDEESGYASYHRDEEWRKHVIEHYELSLRAMAAMCREANVPLVLVHLGSNVRDCPPFKHEPDPNPGEDGIRKERDRLAAFEMVTATEPQDLKLALKLYQRAEAIDAKHALLCYRIARVYDRLGDYERAKTYYLKAKDYDVCPLRMLEEMSSILKRIAEETQTPLVDVRQLLERESPDGIPGSNFFVDHVHPTVDAHQRMARVIVARMRTEKIAPAATSAWAARQRRRAYHRHVRRLDRGYFVRGGRRVGWVERWANRDRMFRETLPNDMRGFLHFGHRIADLGDENMAWNEYRTTIQKHPQAFYPLLKRALDLFQQGRSASADRLLKRLSGVVSGRLKGEVVFARIVIAMEDDQKQTAETLYRNNATALKDVPAESAWAKAFPNALEPLGQGATRESQ